MRKLIWGKAFIRGFKRMVKRNPHLADEIEQALMLLVETPFDPRLESHKLKGKLSGLWACAAGYDTRIIFEFLPGKDGNDNDILLIDVGTHDEVY